MVTNLLILPRSYFVFSNEHKLFDVFVFDGVEGVGKL